MVLSPQPEIPQPKVLQVESPQSSQCLFYLQKNSVTKFVVCQIITRYNANHLTDKANLCLTQMQGDEQNATYVHNQKCVTEAKNDFDVLWNRSVLVQN